VFLAASLEAPISATERGANSAWASFWSGKVIIFAKAGGAALTGASDTMKSVAIPNPFEFFHLSVFDGR
jgi:hypothetical protein